MNVKDFGAKGDVKTVYDGSIEAGTTSLTSDSAPFTDDDHNKEIGIEGAGRDGKYPLKTTIDTVDSPSKVSLNKPALTRVSHVRVTWGSNDKTHVQEAIDKARPGEEIFFPAGIYHVYNISLKSNIALMSTEGATLTQLIGDNFAALFNDSEKSLSEVTFKGLTFDGNNDSLVLNSNPCMMLDLANADNHSRFKILGCQVRNFAYGIQVRRTGHCFFEIADCNFTKIVGGFAIGFRNSDTRYIKITNCKFINCYSGIKIFPDPDKGMWNVCDHVLIERCHFEGDEMHNYPIQFGGGKSHKFDFRFAATHVTVKDCTVLGPSKWYHPVPNGSADQIALYGVKHFAVTGNISNDGGDGGIVIQDCRTEWYHEISVNATLVQV